MAPDYDMAYFDLGLALCRAERYEEGATTIQVALRNDPQMAYGGTNLGLSVTTNVGLAHMNLGRFAEAEACFRRNLRLIAPTHFNLGLTLMKQGRHEEALPHFQRAVESSRRTRSTSTFWETPAGGSAGSPRPGRYSRKGLPLTRLAPVPTTTLVSCLRG